MERKYSVAKVGLLHDHYDADHLAEVKAQMATMGAPTIKAVWMECFDFWAAIEGCHRLRAAYELGIVPVIEEIDYDDSRTPEELGLDCRDYCTVADLVDGAYDATVLEFADLDIE